MLKQIKKALFTEELRISDPDLFLAIESENKRQEQEIELIASENITSLAVMQAQGSVMTNKYAEGYPRKRWYGGCEHVDVVETFEYLYLCLRTGTPFPFLSSPESPQVRRNCHIPRSKMHSHLTN